MMSFFGSDKPEIPSERDVEKDYKKYVEKKVDGVVSVFYRIQEAIEALCIYSGEKWNPLMNPNEREDVVHMVKEISAAMEGFERIYSPLKKDPVFESMIKCAIGVRNLCENFYPKVQRGSYKSKLDMVQDIERTWMLIKKEMFDTLNKQMGHDVAKKFEEHSIYPVIRMLNKSKEHAAIAGMHH